jgi:cellulose synthase/poly-beta-1,6-N-acetylglucosamine synthase-like glycosyltransferase
VGTLVSLVLVTFAGLLASLVVFFCIEILAALMLPQRELLLPTNNDLRRRIAVLVPAHNENTGLLVTLDDIKKQLRSGDRLLLVADNCTDHTAAIAKAAGAEVTERHDLDKIGKGYALEWGLRQLRADPPGIVIIIDADCRLADDTLNRLATASAATNRPVQSLNLMSTPEESSINYQVAMFAFRVKNLVRPLGLLTLHLPCQLMGTGMAFPWEIISRANLATGSEVEDVKLGLQLTRAGHPPLFCPSARVDSQFPSTIKGATSQRKRWEQGHIGMIATTIPRLVYEGLIQRNFRLLAVALDLAIPPLTLLGMLIGSMIFVSGFGVLFGLPYTALIVSAASLSVYVVAVSLCWLKYGRDILPLSSISSVISYVVDKLPLYRQILSHGGSSQWIRTDRGKIDSDVD